MDHKQLPLATEHDSSRTLTENVKNTSNNEHQLSTISLSSSYWEQNKYSAFDFIRQQSLDGSKSGTLGWSKDIIKH